MTVQRVSTATAIAGAVAATATTATATATTATATTAVVHGAGAETVMTASPGAARMPARPTDTCRDDGFKYRVKNLGPTLGNRERGLGELDDVEKVDPRERGDAGPHTSNLSARTTHGRPAMSA